MNYNLAPFFDQYLRDFRIPTLEYSINDGYLNLRWINVIDDFKMPIEIEIDNNKLFIECETFYKRIPIKSDKIKIDKDYYVFSKKIWKSFMKFLYLKILNL